MAPTSFQNCVLAGAGITFGRKTGSLAFAENFSFQQACSFRPPKPTHRSNLDEERCFPLRKGPRAACNGRLPRRVFLGPPSSS